jgi:endoglucanase
MHDPRRRLRAGVAALTLVVLTSTLVACVRNPGPNPTTGDWLHTRGNQIVDVHGDPVWLTGANWFGFNTSERVFHGLWQGNLEGITRSMAERGINIVRVPVSTQLLLEWKDGTTITPNVNLSVNPDLAGLDNLEVFDRFLALAQRYGLKVMLDVHSAEADNAGHIYPVWFKGAITTERFYEAWEWVTARYRTNDTVVAMDVKNEPHGGAGQSPRAKWDGSTDPDNWKHACQTAGRRILAINPNVLILCEGVEIYPRDGSSWDGGEFDTTWWGANLRGVRDHPIDLGTQQDQLVYSPHDYGPSVFQQPWFDGDWDKETLTRDAWDPNWLFIHRQQLAPVLIGEWGGFMDGGATQRWMTALRDLIVEHRLHHTFWAINPNSGDTGGLLTDDWATWDEAKYELLRPALWQHEGRFVSLDHEVPLGNATVGTTVTEVYR